MNDERRYTPGGLSLDERLRDMKAGVDQLDEKIDRLLEQSSNVDKRVALIESKIELHDKILMGVCGAVGLSVVGGVMALVIK